MPKLLVKFDSQRHLVFTLPEGETVIGRGEEAQLLLPNVSVSRRHTRITVSGAAAVVEDLESQNGTTVNGKAVTRQELASRDEIKLGRFSLVYMGDAPGDRFYNGRCVAYLAPYTPGGLVSTGVEETFALSKEALKKLNEAPPVSENAKIVSETDRRRFWYPEDRVLTFGAGGMIPVDGWYVFAMAADVAWDGRRHVIRKLAFWVPVSVNGAAVSKRPLKAGDRIAIAGSRFRYEVDP